MENDIYCSFVWDLCVHHHCFVCFDCNAYLQSLLHKKHIECGYQWFGKRKTNLMQLNQNRTQRQNSSWTYRFTLMFFILQLCMMVWYTFLYHHEAGSDWSILLGKKTRRETCLWQWERYTLQMPLLIISYMAFNTML